jgi:hypothetical protein
VAHLSTTKELQQYCGMILKLYYRTLYLATMFIVLAWLSLPASATTFLSTVPAVQSCCAESIGYPPNASSQQAVRFVLNADRVLGSVTFDLLASFGTGRLIAQIYSETGGLPGTLLASMTAADQAPAGGGLFEIDATTPLLLQAGTPYWLTGTSTDTSTGANWRYSDQFGWRAAKDLPGKPSIGFPDWGNASGNGPAGPGTFQTLVLSYELSTASPEPGTFAFMSLAASMAGLNLVRRRLKKIA